MRRRAVTAALALLASVAPVTARAAASPAPSYGGEVLAREAGIVVRHQQALAGPPGPPSPPQVVLTGSQSSTIDITTTRELVIKPGEVEVKLDQITFGDWRPTGASLGGFSIRALPSGRLISWAVRVPETGLWVGRDDNSARLPRGRYRIGLIANGPATVTLRGTGFKTPIKLTPTSPGGFSGGHVALSPTPLSPGGIGRVPVEVAKKFDVGFTVLVWYGLGAGLAYQRHCLTLANTVCEDSPTDLTDSLEVVPEATYHVRLKTQSYKPAPSLVGRRDAVFDVVTTMATAQHGLALFL